jgi:hypothetical protein
MKLSQKQRGSRSTKGKGGRRKEEGRRGNGQARINTGDEGEEKKPCNEEWMGVGKKSEDGDG